MNLIGRVSEFSAVLKNNVWPNQAILFGPKSSICETTYLSEMDMN